MDNSSLKPADLRKKEKYHPHIKSTVEAFCEKTECGKVVDIGARDGYGVELLSKKGYDACGTDLIKQYVAYARERGRNVFFDDMMKSGLPSNGFDYVFSRHCIEHCSDTVTFLKACARILRPGGTLFLTFPLETYDEWAARKRDDHLVQFGSKDSFRFKNTVFDESFFGKSKTLGIKPEGREVCFIGTTQG